MGCFSALIHFLFFSIFGWWILILMAAGIAAPIVARFRTWNRARRFMAVQAARMENPQNAEVRRELAEIYLEGGRPRKAERFAREAVDVARANPLYEGAVPYPFHRVLGQSLLRCRRPEEAIPVFETALKSKSETGYFEALYGLAICHWRLRNPEKALEWAKHATRENTSSLAAQFRWAQAAARCGKAAEVAEARAAFWRTRAALPRFSREHRTRWALAFLLFGISRHIV